MTLARMIRGCLSGLALAAAAFTATADKSEISSPQVVWRGPDVNTLGAPSRDGRWLSYVDPPSGDLAVRDLRTGGRRFVTRKNPKTQEGEFAYFSVISRDGKQVALAWFNEDHFYDLRLAEIPPEDQKPEPPHVLYRNREVGFVQPCSFSPDGRYVLTLFFRRDNISQIALVSTADGSIRTLKSLNWVYPKRMDFSPDGRWIVYDNLSADKAEERDIFVLAVDGSHESRLLAGPANDLFPLFSPDGGEVLFLSDRSGSSGIWSVPLKDGEAAWEPRLLRDRLGRPLPLGVTSFGDLYYGLRAGVTDIYIGEPGSPLPATPAVGDTPGRNFGAVFSPDGSTLAYLSLRGTENYGLDQRAVLLYSLRQQASRELPVHLAHVESLSWSADGRRLLLSGSDRRARGGLFEYELENGRTETVVLDSNTGYEGLQGVYAPGGREVIYVRPGTPSALVALNLADRSERVLYESLANRNLASPAASPDGKQLAFAELAPGDIGTGDILLLDLSSHHATRLLTLPNGRFTDLTWMPRGDALLVGTEGSSGARLWRVSAAGDSIEPVMDAPKRQPVVSVHPDGRRLALTIGETHSEIWVLEHATRPTTVAQP